MTRPSVRCSFQIYLGQAGHLPFEGKKGKRVLVSLGLPPTSLRILPCSNADHNDKFSRKPIPKDILIFVLSAVRVAGALLAAGTALSIRKAASVNLGLAIWAFVVKFTSVVDSPSIGFESVDVQARTRTLLTLISYASSEYDLLSGRLTN